MDEHDAEARVAASAEARGDALTAMVRWGLAAYEASDSERRITALAKARAAARISLPPGALSRKRLEVDAVLLAPAHKPHRHLLGNPLPPLPHPPGEAPARATGPARVSDARSASVFLGSAVNRMWSNHGQGTKS